MLLHGAHTQLNRYWKFVQDLSKMRKSTAKERLASIHCLVISLIIGILILKKKRIQ